MQIPVNTGFDLEELKNLAVKMTTLPEDKKFINKITRLFENRLKMIEGNSLDWALGEWLAYATLLVEGNNVLERPGSIKNWCGACLPYALINATVWIPFSCSCQFAQVRASSLLTRSTRDSN